MKGLDKFLNITMLVIGLLGFLISFIKKEYYIYLVISGGIAIIFSAIIISIGNFIKRIDKFETELKKIKKEMDINKRLSKIEAKLKM